MIDTLLNILGYSGSDQTITYIVVGGAVALILCLAYKLLDFLFSLVTAVIGGSDKLKF